MVPTAKLRFLAYHTYMYIHEVLKRHRYTLAKFCVIFFIPCFVPAMNLPYLLLKHGLVLPLLLSYCVHPSLPSFFILLSHSVLSFLFSLLLLFFLHAAVKPASVMI